MRAIPSVIGGIETHCEQLYSRLSVDDPTLAITLLIRSGYVPQRRFAHGRLDVRTIWAPRLSGIETALHTFFALIYARLALHPGIVHLHGIGPGLFAPLSRLLGFKTVVTHHAPDYRRPKWGRIARAYLQAGEWATARFAHVVVCVSRSVRDDFLALYPKAAARAVVIPNAGTLPDGRDEGSADILRELGLNAGRYILAVGRLEATKAFDLLVHAFEDAGRRDMKLVIVGAAMGDEAYAEALRRTASPDVVFAGYRHGPALRRLYANAALFVHPSHMEGFGLVVAEALFMNLPVIASDIAPHREFGLGDHCYFRPGDRADLARLLAAPDYARLRSPQAAARQQDNGWDDVARAHLVVLRQLAPVRTS